MTVAFHELGYCAALHSDTRTNERDLVSQVAQVTGIEALAHLELRRRLEQEYALGPALADKVVYFRIPGIDARQIGTASLAGFDKVQSLLQLIQNRERKQVYLGKTGVGHTVLVPVHDVAAFHGPGPGGNHLGDGRTAQHQAANVLPQSPRRVHQLGGHLYQVAPAWGFDQTAESGKLPHLGLQRGGVAGMQLPGEQRKLVFRQAQGFAQILDDALDAVGGHGSGQHGELRPEVPVNPLDEFVPQLPGEVQVYVRQETGVFGDEPFQS